MKKLLLLCLLATPLLSFEGKPKTWVAIGDSITYLNDHLDETGNRVTKGYLTLLSERFPGLRYLNQGHNGWTAIRIAQQFDKLGIQPADVYTVFLGTNDWWSGQPIGTFRDYKDSTGNHTVYGAFRTIIGKLRTISPQAPIILMTPMQRVDFVYIANMKNNAWGSYRDKNGQQLAQVVAAIDSIGAYEHCNVVDLYHQSGLELKQLVKYKRLKDTTTGQYRNYPYPKFIGIPFHPERDEYPYPLEAVNVTYDGLHPSDKGYRIIADALAKEMKKIYK
ncbi:SGNH/GDSL hydrolase family protein [Chitinophaga horti]|uniref:SGNH/GDSL hydrolase family protein n=1 Tax=Chitinophaga horti TaxID=2920382 RepID=A0ABY6JBY7_9BACT|nr:SGNH/GDSL hydrolase family protein [Chitinophaga horti]UYQ95819.1 SGNH/GDSL hydrolase family protein [Chitinophaga horti]